MKIPMFKKADILLVLVLLALGAGSLVFLRGNTAESSVVSVYSDGTLVESCVLSDSKTFEISTEYGSNTVVVDRGTVTMLSSDCAGQDCVRMGSISREGQVILCLPHRLTVIIEGSSGPDSVAY